MHVENGRKRVERVAWQAVPADTAESGSPGHEERGWKRKETRGVNIEISPTSSFLFFSPSPSLRKKRIERRNSEREEEETRSRKRKTKGKRKRDRKSWVRERERGGEGYPRTWVTNLYEFAWFIGRKFNNGRPDPPLPFPRKRGCGERVAADRGIYDTLVWIPASPSNSTIFHRDTWYSWPIIDSTRIYIYIYIYRLRFEHVLYHKRFMWTRVATDIYLPALAHGETPSAGGVHSERSTKLSGCVALSIAPAENSFCKSLFQLFQKGKEFLLRTNWVFKR